MDTKGTTAKKKRDGWASEAEEPAHTKRALQTGIPVARPGSDWPLAVCMACSLMRKEVGRCGERSLLNPHCNLQQEAKCSVDASNKTVTEVATGFGKMSTFMDCSGQGRLGK